MEHLTKQQIVLLTLLVSFVTSLSTGIVTVSLMDQSPSATHTISQVIEKTIQQAAPQNAAVGIVSISVDDQLASSTSLVENSLVKIKNSLTGEIVGLGIVTSNNGMIISDSSIVKPNQSYSAVDLNGNILPLTYQISTTSVQTFEIIGSSTNLQPIIISNSYALGQKVFTLSGTSSPTLNSGLIAHISTTTIDTTLDMTNITPGSPLFDINGAVIGLFANNGSNGSSTPEYYSLAN